MRKVRTIQEQLGLRVRELRQAQGLSQEAFADCCDLDRTYIGGIERGELILTQDTQLKGSVAGNRKQAGWNNDHLKALLLQIAKR